MTTAALKELCHAFLSLRDESEMLSFLKDICTPQEIKSLSERLRVCKLLEKEELSYREIHKKTGASLTTIGRVARFLREEKNGGYKTVLKNLK